MPFLWVSLAISLETRAAAFDKNRLVTAALESARPRTCRPDANAEHELWSRARAGDAEHFCELLAHGYARLAQTPSEALQAAEAATAIAGASADALVLGGRAELRLGQPALAFEQFRKAEAEAPRAFFEPKALHDYAHAASLAGQPLEAVRLYRRLVSQSALLDDTREQAELEIEAAAHVLAYVPDGSDEALGYLSQVRRAAFGLTPLTDALRLLIADRNGRTDRDSRSKSAPSLAALTQPVTGVTPDRPLLPPGEIDALRASILEVSDRAASNAAWQAFLEHASSQNVWLEHARKKRADSPAKKRESSKKGEPR